MKKEKVEVPTKTEILEKWKQIDAKFSQTEQPIYELAQLEKSGLYWQFIELVRQAEALANADCASDQKQVLIIDLFEKLVYVEKKINDAKANAEQAKAERIRQLKDELKHAKEIAGEYVSLDKIQRIPLFSESLLNYPGQWTEAEITAAVYWDIEILRCHQWEIIGMDETNKYHLTKPEEADNDENSFSKRTEKIAQNAANPKVKTELLLTRKHAKKGAQWTNQTDPNSEKIAELIFDKIIKNIDAPIEFKAEKNKIVASITRGKTAFAKSIISLTKNKKAPTAKTLNKWLQDYMGTMPETPVEEKITRLGSNQTTVKQKGEAEP